MQAKVTFGNDSSVQHTSSPSRVQMEKGERPWEESGYRKEGEGEEGGNSKMS